MSSESPPAFTQANTFGAEQTRRAITALLQRGASIGSIAGGLVASGDMTLTPPGSGMTVNVAPGEAYIAGSSSATQGGYYCRVSSSTSLALAASNATNPRIDMVAAQVTDAAYSGVTNTFAPVVLTGTPTASATLANLLGAPSAPASSLVLGYVLVPAASTSVTGGNISNVAGRVLLANALQPTTVSANTTAIPGQLVVATASCTVGLPSAPAAGAQIAIVVNYAATGAGAVTVSANGTPTIYGVGLSAATSFTLGARGAYALLEFDGTNWAIIGGQQDSGWVFPSLIGSWPTVTNYSAPSYRQIADRVFLRGGVTNGTGATNHFTMTVPSPAFTQVLLLPVAFAASTVTISTGGGSLSTANVTSGQQVNLDGLSYSMS